MLGCKICEEFGFVIINCSIESILLLIKEIFFSSYLDCFEGLGIFKDMKFYYIMFDLVVELVIYLLWLVLVYFKDFY